MAERRRVKTWEVAVNNSGESNMTNVVGRYLTLEAVENVAHAFRSACYADPYNYRERTFLNHEKNTVEKDTSAHVAVYIQESTCAMSDEEIRLAQSQGIAVLDTDGEPIVLD